ncbi:MAG: hypothetical protein IJ630_04005 [Treponema sp.]|nr:hypothetical protein [Treponema sp.]
MKKVLLCLFAFSVSAFSGLLLSCKEKSSGNDGDTSIPVKKEQMVSSSRIIYSGWDLYEERNDGKMYAVREAECGDEVKIFLNEDGSVEQKKATRHLQSGKEENLDFVHVLYEEEEFWTRDIFIAGPNYMYSTVVLKDAFIYSAPDGTSITGSQITEGSCVVLEQMASPSNDFFKVVIYNGKPFGKEVYISQENLALGPQAVLCGEIARVFSKIDEKTPTAVRDEILQKLIADSSKWDSKEKDYLTEKILKLYEKTLLPEEIITPFLTQNISEQGANLSEKNSEAVSEASDF